MIRAAAKNYPHVAVLVQPGSYEPIIEILKRLTAFYRMKSF
jgi:AICAR transformylase/IMP cyclohydrolase PurH